MERAREYLRVYRDQIHQILQAAWVVIALTTLHAQFSTVPSGWILFALGAVLSLAYAINVARLRPRLATTSVLCGAIAVAMMMALQRYLGFPSSPLLLGVLVASGVYLYLGDRWSREVASAPA